MRITNKQMAILKVVIAGNTDAGKFSPCDLDQIIARIGYNPTKDAIQFSIRKLIAKGLIFKSGFESRRDRRHVLISPTTELKTLFASKDNHSYIETVDEFLV